MFIWLHVFCGWAHPTHAAGEPIFVSRFSDAGAFNRDISSWSLGSGSSVINVEQMFFYASSFGQNLCGWNPIQGTLDVGSGGVFTATNCPFPSDPLPSLSPWLCFFC